MVVDDFGIKYVGREHVNHLIKCIKEKYELTKDWAISIAGSSCFGIIINAHLTYQCWDVSKSSSKNTSIKCLKSRNIAHTLQRQSNTAPRHKPHSPLIFPPNYLMWKSKKSNVSLVAFYTTHERSRSPSWWPSVPLQASKREAWRTQWPRLSNFWTTSQCTRMQPYGFERQTWSWTSIPMHLTF